MPRYIERPYLGTADLPLLIDFAQRQIAARPGRTPYYHPGDFVWQLYAFDATDDVRLWLRDGAVVACAIFEPPLNFRFDVSLADDGELSVAVVAWAEARCALTPRATPIPIAYQMLGDDTLSTSVMEGDERRIAFVEARGYVRSERGGVRYARDLAEPIPDDPSRVGARVRHVSASELEARVELHRDAWSVWGESSFSIDAYRKLRAAPLYDPALDIVVEHGGELVSYSVCWLDDANGIGYFEPVGTRPSATGRGFGRAALREGFRRLRDRGMRTATVGTASINEPAKALYLSAGFSAVDREHFYTKRV